MRRLSTVTITLVLVLTACTESPSPTESGLAADKAALASVEVVAEPGKRPAVTFPEPLNVSAVAYRVLSPGTGAELETGQVMTLQYLAIDGQDGTALGSTYDSEPHSMTLGDVSFSPELNAAFADQQVGVRVLLASPGETAATLMVVEVTAARSIPSRAQGQPVTPTPGLPAVTVADDGEPALQPAAGAPPAELVVQPLLTGSGPVVRAGQTLVVQYSGWLWDGTAFDSSWDDTAPFTQSISADSVIAGWQQGLVGQTVGSQVLLVIPPELAYGTAGEGVVPGGATVVYVIDILDAS